MWQVDAETRAVNGKLKPKKDGDKVCCVYFES